MRLVIRDRDELDRSICSDL